MKMTYIYGALVVLVFGGLIALRGSSDGSARQEVVTVYDTFAQCLADAGAKFYGAYWCPHCQAQKKMFQNSKKLPYIECSTPDGNSQLPVCAEAGITGYPTWTFSDGSTLDGERQLAELGEKTGCTLPTL